jgi:hypothetical protein
MDGYFKGQIGSLFTQIIRRPGFSSWLVHAMRLGSTP